MEKRRIQLLFLIVILMGISWWFLSRKSPQQHALKSRSLATEMLAKELVKLYPGARALVVSNPFAQTSDRRQAIQAVEDAGIDGLKRGFGNSIVIEDVVFPEIRPHAAADPRAVKYPKSSSTPLSFLITADAFDQLHAAHPTCDLIVSLIGFPAEWNTLKIWVNSGAPHFALLLPDLRVLGSVNVLKEAFRRDKLAALILPKPGGPDAQVPFSEEPSVEFEKRFLLVTAENIAQMIEEYPDKFDIQPYPVY